MQGSNFLLGDLSSDALVGRKPHQETPEFDITAMVDLVFMMNIYFLVTFITLALAEINLPTASHVQPLDADEAVVFTLLGSLDGRSVSLSVGGDDSPPITDAEAQRARIAAALDQGMAADKKLVLIKAEKKVRLGELFRIVTASAGEGLKLHVAVVESDAGP